MKAYLAALALAIAMAFGISTAPAEARTKEGAAKSDNDEKSRASTAKRKSLASNKEKSQRKNKRTARASKVKTKVAEHAKHRVAKEDSKPAKSRKVVSSGGGDSVIASVYWSGHTTANGEHYNPDGITAAHKTLPFGTKVKVTNPSNGRAVVTRINDRGPFIAGRSIDLSRGTAHAIGFGGLGKVNMQVLGK